MDGNVANNTIYNSTDFITGWCRLMGRGLQIGRDHKSVIILD